MDCVNCSSKVCRSGEFCLNTSFSTEKLVEEYHDPLSQQILQAAAVLVDNGRAGTLSRFQELAGFIKSMNYANPGLAYCYGMENTARLVKDYFKREGIKIKTVSCTVGGLKQDEVNQSSCIHKVSCNPLGQAKQLNDEGIDFVMIMGICLGHDILLQKNLAADFTTLVVKDRVFNHNPLEALK
jgi:uncharacterized metal-binding protein